MDEQLARIAEKLRLSAPSGAAAPFRRIGMKNDPYQLDPPLPVERVEEFEREHRVRLPESYRRFITEIGDGDGDGAGRYSLADGYDELLDAYEGWEHLFGTDEDPLGQESLLRPNQTYPQGWWDDHYGPDDRPDVLRGTLPISEGGCSDFFFMVLTGPAAGAIFSANWDGNAEPTQVADDYLTWLEGNLDMLALLYTRSWGVDDHETDEAALVRTLTGDPAEFRRMYAAWSLRAVPRRGLLRRRVGALSPDAIAALDRALTDEHYIARAMALDTVEARRLRSLEPAVRRVFDDDPVGLVRDSAFRVLREFEVPDLAALAAVAVESQYRWLREHAIQVLSERHTLTADILSRLLDHPEWTTRREAIGCLPDFTGPVTVLLIKALDDPVRWLQLKVIDMAEAHGGPEIEAKLRHMLDTTTDEQLAWKLEFALGLRKPGQIDPVR